MLPEIIKLPSLQMFLLCLLSYRDVRGVLLSIFHEQSNKMVLGRRVESYVLN